ncbi:energy transducer TonB, partial [Candidatus Neomarinimicrobiota bacterium]
PKSISAFALAVVLLAAVSPARGDYESPPIPVGGWVTLNEMVVYPEIAWQAGMEGEVIVHIYINEQGRAAKMEVVKGSWKTGFVDAAWNAIGQTLFEPAARHGTVVSAWISVRVVFSRYG